MDDSRIWIERENLVDEEWVPSEGTLVMVAVDGVRELSARVWLDPALEGPWAWRDGMLYFRELEMPGVRAALEDLEAKGLLERFFFSSARSVNPTFA